MSTDGPSTEPEIDQLLFEEFGVNAKYVSELLQRFRYDPFSVDEEWREFFSGLLKEEAPRPDLSAPPGTSPKSTGVAVPPLHAEAEPLLPGVSQTPIRGGALRIVENMEASLQVPTATSQRKIPVKLLEENRRLINQRTESTGLKISFTHILVRALIQGLQEFPGMNDAYEEREGTPSRLHREEINLGVAIDVVRKDGSHSLLVPNIKSAQKLSFGDLVRAYDGLIKRAREGKIDITDFQETTVSLTNPGMLGTTVSNPRLMAGQGMILASGAIEYPVEFAAMPPDAVSRLGISKVVTLTCTYDHRIIQGAESGALLAFLDELLRGKHDFYDKIFEELRIPYRPYRWSVDRRPILSGEGRGEEEVGKQARVLELINAYRVRGHLIADTDPLGCKILRYHPELDIENYGLTVWDLDRHFLAAGLGGHETASLREISDLLRKFYCGKVGVEYRHIQSPEEKEWIRSRVEREQLPVSPEVQHQILWKLISAEQFEKFLAAKYPGQKRFSIEGAEVVVALLDQLIEGAACHGIEDITIGMSHRGRLNVIANVIGRFCERIFTSFEGSIHPQFPHDQGDVKYHRGASGMRETCGGQDVALTVLPNPSHLEFVDPVVEGMVRAKQDFRDRSRKEGVDLRDPARDQVLAVLVHGDAAFIGEGIVAETLNLSQLPGYRTNGTVHLIINNQLGFTTPPEEGRSSTYSSDVARMVQAPIFHVNGDDPDVAYQILQVALDYRQQFHKDVVIDVVAFRRYGHNEEDEPTYTQPIMYRLIRAHPGVRELYARRLVGLGLMDEAGVQSLIEERWRRYENALLGAKEIVARNPGEGTLGPSRQEVKLEDGQETGIEHRILRDIAQVVTTIPQGFQANPKIVGLLARRANMVEGKRPVDWGMAETLAFGSLLLEGTAVRMAGQDTVRGTFSQRHAALYDTQTGRAWIPLGELSPQQGRFQVYDSPLSEASALAFEYGYSIASPKDLVLWEAQFGDFINAAQVIVDQFIAAGEEKWAQASRVVLLLPHGYEGQGPDHSSGRIERFLQLCASGNMQVAYCTTSAQYFHLLRRQARQNAAKPLVIFTPKSLLRFPEASSSIEEFTRGRFQPVLDDPAISSPDRIRRILLCSGKIFYELKMQREKLQENSTAIVRVEQFYPFPEDRLSSLFAKYSHAVDLRWVQEEPANMGGWSFMQSGLHPLLPTSRRLQYIGRPASPSTATGSYTTHQMEQHAIERNAFAPLE